MAWMEGTSQVTGLYIQCLNPDIQNIQSHRRLQADKPWQTIFSKSVIRTMEISQQKHFKQVLVE